MLNKFINLFRKVPVTYQESGCHDFLSKLDHSIVWAGNPPSYGELNHKAMELHREMWDNGTLPIQIHENKWVVGYRGELGFSRSWASAVVVGPKKPSKQSQKLKFEFTVGSRL